MIYLKPSGGLCNRMRSIESALNLCEKYNVDLTVLWIKNQNLNCDFESLFLPLKKDNVNIIFREFENNYINHYCNKIRIFKKQKIGFLKYLIYHFKKYRHHINLDLKMMLLLWNIEEKNLVLDTDLRKKYNKTSISTHDIDKLDNAFLEETKSLFKKLFKSQSNVFIESCYRISPIKDILIFKPKDSLYNTIRIITEKFNNTIGIHIRRSDHIEAIEKSKTSYFIKKVYNYIDTDNDVTFFLATDDLGVKDELIKEFGSRIITNDIKSFNRNKKSAIQSALIDLYCLSKTKEILGSYHSTFSQTAAIIGKVNCTTIN